MGPPAPIDPNVVGDGWCRYGSDGRDWIGAMNMGDVGACRDTCQTKRGCTHFAFTPGVAEGCHIHMGTVALTRCVTAFRPLHFCASGPLGVCIAERPLGVCIAERSSSSW